MLRPVAPPADADARKLLTLAWPLADCDAISDVSGVSGLPADADTSGCTISEASLTCSITACTGGMNPRNAGGSYDITCSAGTETLTGADGGTVLECVSDDTVCGEVATDSAAIAAAASIDTENFDMSGCTTLDSSSTCTLDACATGFFELVEGTGEVACAGGGDPYTGILTYTAGGTALACVGECPAAATPPPAAAAAAPLPPPAPAPGRSTHMHSGVLTIGSHATLLRSGRVRADRGHHGHRCGQLHPNDGGRRESGRDIHIHSRG